MKAKTNVICAMLMFGSIGLFVRGIDLPSDVIALVRGGIGCLVLVAASIMMKRPMSRSAIRANGGILLLSGAAIGFNWIFLFEAYRYTTVSCATLSYYFAPVFVTLLSPLVLKEALTGKKLGCVCGAVFGMVLVSNVLFLEKGHDDLVGIFLGLIAAALYASVVLLNKFIKNLSGIETTAAQLGVAAVVLLPYTIVTALSAHSPMPPITAKTLGLLLFVGVVHTGIGYLMYFSGLKKLPAQTSAALSYIDPITAILLSVVFLGETMSGMQVVGAGLVLGATWVSGLDKNTYI